MAKTGFVTVGKVVRAHGLQGELCIASYADSPFLFQDLFRVYLKQEGRHPRKFILRQSRMHSKGVLLRLENLFSRDAARLWLGAEVLVRRRDLPEPGPDEVYQTDVEGIGVVLADGTPLGEVEAVDSSAGQELWTIKTPGGREVLLPAVDAFILEVDPDRGQAVIDPPPGLLALYGVTHPK